MTTISASLVKELRDKTGAGMMDCKAALGETNGDMESAVDWLRKKGLSKAAAKSGRIAAEGLIGITTAAKSGAVVEVNSETDFVARNEKFQEMVRGVTSLAPKAKGSRAKLLAMTYPKTSSTVEEHIKEMVATIGENMSLRRTAALSVKDGVVGEYMHNKASDGLGKIGVLVALDSKGGDKKKLAELGRQIAMHVAARSPVSVDIAGAPAELLEREKAIVLDKNKGKPAQVLEKITESVLKTFAKENCLLDQTYILDDTKSVGQALKEHEGDIGAPVKVAAFVRYALGEGIDKKDDDFAAEVAAAAGKK